MIPKEFYKEYMPLYTKDFDTEIYSTIQQSNSYRHYCPVKVDK